MLHELLRLLAAAFSDPLSGNGYQFWSGLGSDLSEALLVGMIWHQINCAEPGCWRLGHRGREHRCRRHAGSKQ